MGEKTKHFLSHKKKATRREWESRNRASFRESGGEQEQPGECVGAEQHGGSLAPLCKDSRPRHGQLSHPKCSANCEHPLLPPSSQPGQLPGLGLRSLLLPQEPASTWHQVRGEHTERAFPGLGSRRDFVSPALCSGSEWRLHLLQGSASPSSLVGNGQDRDTHTLSTATIIPSPLTRHA